MNTLLTALRKAGNATYTENGALTHESTLSDVLDFFYHASARRGRDNTDLFEKAYKEDKNLAILVAFYTRDIRGGQGERETFKQVLRWLYQHDREMFVRIVDLVPVYGRWDDILTFTDSVRVQEIVREQLFKDARFDSPSLLAKWMPSANASSAETKKLAYAWMNILNMTPRIYRKLLSRLRGKLALVETLMSAGKFSEINYAHVPSRAALILRKAFSKRDAARYVAYLESVKAGKSKINSAALYPYELVVKYLSGLGEDATIEAQWAALPNYADSAENALVVADVSGSMHGRPMEVCISLALYIAERNNGVFKDHFITFSANPKLQRITGSTLFKRVNELSCADWGMNTDLQKVFDLILTTAKVNNVPESDMPTKVFIVSDMQFDTAVRGKTNYDVIRQKYEQAGYRMPIVVFWNVDSRRNEAPVTQDANGVYLVSGASPSIFKAAINTQAVTPVDLMLEVLQSDRYLPVYTAISQ